MGWGMHFYCDPCDDDWWEDKLIPNLKSKYWIKFSKEDYDKWGKPYSDSACRTLASDWGLKTRSLGSNI